MTQKAKGGGGGGNQLGDYLFIFWGEGRFKTFSKKWSAARKYAILAYFSPIFLEEGV